MHPSIEVNELRKRYGRAVALDGMSFTVATGQVTGFIGGRVTLRTPALPEAARLLERTGATVTAAGRDTLTISGFAPERVVALLGDAGVPFSEVSAPRATLEEAYLQLTHDAVDFRAAAVEEATR